MAFEIVLERKPSAKRKGYEFFIRNRDLKNWSMMNLLPYMQKVSQESKGYKLTFDMDTLHNTLGIRHNEVGLYEARMVLGPSATSDIKCLTVYDGDESRGRIGMEMINRFVHSIEDKV